MLPPSSIAIADNQAISNAGIKAFAQQTLNVSHFVDVHNKKELMDMLVANPATIVIVDYTNMDFRDIDDFLIVNHRFETVRWILLSSTLSEQFLRRAAAEENISILLKDCDAYEIRDCLLATVRGDQYICRQVKATLNSMPGRTDPVASLTPTEMEILRLIAQGLTVKEIAARRVSSVHTITTHKKNIFLKIGVNNVYEATKYALRAGLVELMEYYI